ncbi:MAG: contact-dependent growth inhibition system immunity protein [Marinicella sp.]|nr:hypothetical protein [Xanthomonadales bacterium]
MEINKSISDVEGPWVGDTPTALTQRCKKYWNVPIKSLPNLMLATYLNQRIAVNYVLLEAEKRIEQERFDDAELFEGQLVEAIERARLNQ